MAFVMRNAAAYHCKFGTSAITTSDGTVLHADFAIPEQEQTNQTFPIIILSNSWSSPQMEYIAKVIGWCERGYIMLEYETRGFFSSGGEINTAGPLDQADHADVVTWALKQDWPVNPDRIGACGLSYGGGIALLAAARDPRVKLAIVLSGWYSLLEALWSGESPSLVWGTLLVKSGASSGREPKSLTRNWEQLLKHENETGLKRWAALRSGETYMDGIAERQTPIFICSNVEDRLFGQQGLDMFQSIRAPKFMMLNQGLHGTAEATGLVDLPNNPVWINVLRWTDYWLKGKATGIMDEPPLSFQLRNNHKDRLQFKSWPSPKVSTGRFFFTPRGNSSHFGGLSDAVSPQAQTDAFTYDKKTGLSAGLPIVGEVLQVYVDVPILSDLPKTSTEHAIVYHTEPVKHKTRLCGIVNATMSVTPNAEAFQVYAFLYDVDLLGIGKFLAHGPRTVYNATVGEENEIHFKMRPLCYDVEAGHRIAIGFSQYCDLYEPASKDSSNKLEVHYGIGKTYLDLPINTE